MSHPADLPEEVSARVRTRVQIHSVATGALKGILLYEAPQIISATTPGFGSEFHRARVPWLAAFVADRHGRLRYAARSETLDVRPVDGACFAQTLGSDPATPLLADRPEGCETLHGSGCPAFLGEWVSSALFHGSDVPDLTAEVWAHPILDRLQAEVLRRIDSDVRPALTVAEGEAWSIVDASPVYSSEAHSALRDEGPDGRMLREFARRNPFFCGEVLSHAHVRDAVLAGVADRDVHRMAQAAASDPKAAKPAGAASVSVARLPISHAMLLAGRRFREPSWKLGKALEWYGRLPPEWLPDAEQERDCLAVIELAENSGFRAAQARVAFRNGDWTALRRRLDPLANRIGEAPERTLRAMWNRFSSDIVWPLSRIAGNEDLKQTEARHRHGGYHRWDLAVGRQLVGAGMDLGSLLALLVRYRECMPVIAGVEARHAPAYGPAKVTILGDEIVRQEIEPGLTVALTGVSRFQVAGRVSDDERPVFASFGGGVFETFDLPAVEPASVPSSPSLPMLPRPDLFEPALFASDLAMATLSPAPGGGGRLGAYDYDLQIRCTAPILERGVSVGLTVRRTDPSLSHRFGAESLLRLLLGDRASPVSELGRVAMEFVGLDPDPEGYVAPDQNGCLFTRIRPERDALEASLEAWRPVLPRGLRKLDLDGMAEKLRQVSMD